MRLINSFISKYIFLFAAYYLIINPSVAYATYYTSEVWDYDNVTHTATYRCPSIPDCNCETDTFGTYGYPAILVTVGWAGAWVYTKFSDYTWDKCKRAVGWTRDRTMDTVWPWTRNTAGPGVINCCRAGFRNLVNGAQYAYRELGGAVQGFRDRWNRWRGNQPALQE